MSQYKPYPAYKDSSVEWLGRVPEHWRFELLTNVCRFQSGKAHEPFIDDDGGFICVNSKFVSTGGASQKFCTQNLSPAYVDDILVVMSDLPNGRALAKAFHSDQDGIYAVNQRVCIISPVECSPRFLFYLLDRNCHFLSHDDGINQTHLPNSAFTKFKFYLPPFSEQQAIAMVLDREVVRIDALIEKKTRFIELLREKRQALITHAVTKGLDPNLKMKDSGLEWLGEVPEHWAVCKLSFRYSVELGKMLDEKRITSASLRPYLRNQDVQWGQVNTDSLPEMDIHPEELSRYTVRNGDLLVCEGGDVGRAAIWRGENGVIGYQKALHRLRPRSDVADTAEFFFFALMAAKLRGVFDESDSKATIAHLPAEKFRQYRFAFPPDDEQCEIASHIRTHTQRLEKILSTTEHSIALLKERRSALITAAVTGQIDLREAV